MFMVCVYIVLYYYKMRHGFQLKSVSYQNKEYNIELLTLEMLIKTNLGSYFFPLKTNLGLTWWNGLISIYREEFPV